MQSPDEDDHEDEVFQLHEDLLRKDERIFELEKSLEKKTTGVTNLQKRVKELEAQVKGFDDRTKNFLSTIDDLNLKVKKAEDASRKHVEESTRYRETKRRLEDQISELISKTGDSTGQLLDLKDDIKSKTSENELLRNNVTRLSKEVEVSREAFRRLENNLQAELREKERKIEDLLISDQHMSIEIEKREDIIKHLEDKIDDMVSGDSMDQLASLMSEGKDKSREILRLEDEVGKLRKQIDVMDRSQEKASDDVASLEKSLRDKDEVIIREQKVVRDLQDKLKFLEDQLVTAKERNDFEVKQRKSEIDQCANLMSEFKDKTREVLSLEDEVGKLRQQIDVMNRSQEKASDDVASLEKSLQDKDEILHRQEKVVMDLQDKLKFLEDQLMTAKERNDFEMKQRKSEMDQCASLMSELKDKAHEALGLEDEVGKLRQQIDAMNRSQEKATDHVTSLEKSLRDKDEIIHRQEKVVMDLQDKLKFMEDQLVTAEERNDFEIRQKKLEMDQLASLMSEGKDKAREVLRMEVEVDKLRKQIDVMDQSQEKASDVVASLEKSLRDKDEVILRDQKVVTDLQDKLKFLEDQLVASKERNGRRNDVEMKQKKSEIYQLEARVDDLLKVIANLETQLAELNQQFVSKQKESALLSDELRATLDSLTQKEKEVDSLLALTQQAKRSPGGITTKTSVAITSGKTSTQLTSSTTTSSLISNGNGVAPPTTDEEREQYESQIEFLNSVIVDMQKKNDDLRSRLQIMEFTANGIYH